MKAAVFAVRGGWTGNGGCRPGSPAPRGGARPSRGGRRLSHRTPLHIGKAGIPCPLPIVLGHEGVGVVEEVSSGVNDIVPGPRVVFTWRPRCGECEYCVTGRPVMCVYGRVQASSGGLMDGTSRLRRSNEEIHHFLGVPVGGAGGGTASRRTCPDSRRYPPHLLLLLSGAPWSREWGRSGTWPPSRGR